MKNRFFSTIIFLFVFAFYAFPASVVETVERITNQNIEISSAKDLHITAGESAIVNSQINLASQDAWLFFDNINPARVLQDYASSIKIFGEDLAENKNVQIRIYKHGTIVVPQDSLVQPLTIFREQNFGGDSFKCGLNSYYRPDNQQDYLSKPLGQMNNATRSFKLKRGYMATFANNADGTGYSRVYIADKEDIEIPAMQPELDKCVSFIRVFKWEWVAKKGWCGTGSGAFSDAALTNSSWLYTWSADLQSSVSSEWVPMRHNSGWPSWGQINEVNNSTHLLGFNEPDRSDQALMTVDEAIAQWPEMMKSGLRIGSPAPSDPWNGSNWLYRFMDKCAELDYRVDYVVLHTYWGNKKPSDWYKDLKAIHERTGRPLWITEWNNGANWTGESWPSDVAGQQAKQLADLKGILQVLDTASFVERYSIYNWVEDKRAIILNGSLTPAGEYYAANKPDLAYNSANEVIPTWKIKAPSLADLVVSKDGTTTTLTWSDPNGALTTGYIVERQFENEEYQKIAEINDAAITTFIDSENTGKSGYVKYRVTGIHENSSNLTSNESSYYISAGNEEQFGRLSPGNASPISCIFKNVYSQSPNVIFGTASYNNGSGLPFTTCVNQLDGSSFQFNLAPWIYLGNPTFSRSEDIPFISLSTGKYQWGSIVAQANTIQNINSVWKTITFTEPFESVPVVFATQVTNRSQLPTTVRIKNVTQNGFDVMLQKEEGQTKVLARENVCYVAATSGTGTFAGKKLVVGRTEDNIVGGFYKSYKIVFNETVNTPALFASMQTVNDSITSTLRYNKITSADAIIFKSRETSVSNTISNIATETVGWMVLDVDLSGQNSIQDGQDNAAWSIYPNPVSDVLYIGDGSGEPVNIKIFNTVGAKIIDKKISQSLNVSDLENGLYIIMINNNKVFRFLKK